MFDVVVPKLNNNDQSYTLLDWLVEDGQQVRKGDPLAELETSKALTELEAAQDGIVQCLVVSKFQCRHGEVIASCSPPRKSGRGCWPRSPVPRREEPSRNRTS